MDYANIVEIAEFENYSTVNKYLKCGWILLSASVAVAPYPKSLYSVGWSKEKGEVQYPPEEIPRVKDENGLYPDGFYF